MAARRRATRERWAPRARPVATGAAGTAGTTGAGRRDSGARGATGSAGVTGGGGAGGCTITATSTLGTIPTVGIVTFTTSATGVTAAEIRFGLLSTGPTMTAPVDLTQASYRTLLLGMKGSSDYVYRIVVTSSAGDLHQRGLRGHDGDGPEQRDQADHGDHERVGALQGLLGHHRAQRQRHERKQRL